ncbi:TPA: hypothetical protein KD869_002839 [Vibrio parahaemolyticus]|nr:hypothetical protein [Vibrio parahaemolyticus]HBC3949094.1 hypothetical protein [Vibrio parahaemolyticus]
MKITKAHVQVMILIVGGIIAAATWVAPKLTHHTSTPAPVSVPAKQAKANAITERAVVSQSAPTSPTITKAPKPKTAEREPFQVNAQTQALIDGSVNLAVAKVDALVETEKSRSRKAKSDGKKDAASTLDAQLGLTYSPPSSTAVDAKPAAPKPAIDRFTLRGLSIDGSQSSAYLAFDAGQPFLVKAGQTVKGVRVTNINANGVRLTQGTRARVLDGGL